MTKPHANDIIIKNNLQGEVQFLTGGNRCNALARERMQIRCDSEADGKVRTEEEIQTYSIFRLGIFYIPGLFS